MYQDEKSMIETLDDPFPSFKQWQDDWNKDYISVEDKTDKEQYDSSADLILEDIPTKKVIPKITKPKVKKTKTGSKAQKAISIYKLMIEQNNGEFPARKDAIKQFVEQLDMTPKGASTYVYNTQQKIKKL